MKLLELLKQLFGQNYLNKIIGTRTNIAKPIKMDRNSPYKLYSDKAFNDSELLSLIEKKLQEYGPYVLSNKNASEVKNFEMNARRALTAKNKGKVTTEKPEAKILDIGTKKKVDNTGIMKLKQELGLPEGVEPGSTVDKAIKESAEYKMKQQGVKSILDEKYVLPKSQLTLEEEAAIAKINERMARNYSAVTEGKRRAVLRQVLLKDERINLPENVRKSLDSYADLKGGGDQNMDPLKVFENYYERDDEVLGTLDGIIDTARNEFEAADTFLSAKNFKVKKPDPEDLAEGGRPGYGYGTGLKLINILKKQGTNAMKEIKRSIDNIFPTGDAKYDADVVVDEIMENLNIDRDAVDGYDIMDLYSKAYSTLTKQRFDAKQLAKSINQRGKSTVTTADKVPTPKKTLKSIEETGTIDISDADIAEEFKNFMKRNDPESYEKLEAMMAKVNTKTRTDNAGGGLNYLMGL